MNSSLRVWRADLCLKSSRVFLFLILLLHVAAITALMQTGFVWYWRFPLLLLVLLAGFLCWRQEKNKAGMILREQTTSWWLETATQQTRATLQHSQIWRYLVVMDFLCQQDSKRWRQCVVLFPDSVSADGFRRLRVRLRYGPRQQELDGL